MKKRKNYTDEEVLADIRRAAKELGSKSLSLSQFQKLGGCTERAVKNHFGSWNKGVEAAGLVPNPIGNQTKYEFKFKRHGVPEGRRLVVLRRDRFRCALCGASPAFDDDVDLHVDHIFPVARGGTSGIHNLWTLCDKCNQKKKDNYSDEIAEKAFLHRLECNKERLLREMRRAERKRGSA